MIYKGYFQSTPTSMGRSIYSGILRLTGLLVAAAIVDVGAQPCSGTHSDCIEQPPGSSCGSTSGVCEYYEVGDLKCCEGGDDPAEATAGPPPSPVPPPSDAPGDDQQQDDQQQEDSNGGAPTNPTSMPSCASIPTAAPSPGTTVTTGWTRNVPFTSWADVCADRADDGICDRCCNTTEYAAREKILQNFVFTLNAHISQLLWCWILIIVWCSANP